MGYSDRDLPAILQESLQGNLLPADKHLLVAVSGGVDSVALLLALCAVRAVLPLRLTVVTVDHSVRVESAADAQWVLELCQSLDVPCVVRRVGDTSKAHLSEGQLRDLRHQALVAVALEHGLTHIALAHHRDDQVETVLMRLLRGTGLHGLGGMTLRAPSPVSDQITLIRPLLDVPKETLIAYVAAYGSGFRTDSTNQTTQYQRNALRHLVLPALRAYAPSVDRALLTLADHARVDGDALDHWFSQVALPHIARDTRTWQVPLTIFSGWHEAIQRLFVRQGYAHLTTQEALDLDHIRKVVALAAQGHVGISLMLPHGITAQLQDTHTRQRFVVLRYATPMEETSYSQQVLLADTPLEWGQQRLLLSPTPFTGSRELWTAADAFWQVRTRRNGDRIQPPGMHGQHVKLNAWFVDHRVPRGLRDTLALVCVNDTIAAVLLPDQILVTHPFLSPTPPQTEEGYANFIGFIQS